MIKPFVVIVPAAGRGDRFNQEIPKQYVRVEGQSIFSQIRDDAQESLTILAGIHWVSHHPDVPSKLARLIVTELNKILCKLSASNYSISDLYSKIDSIYYLIRSYIY